MSNKKVYGILGSGDARSSVVTAGLLDVNGPETTYLVHVRRKPQGAVETVYDFLADHDANFIAYHRIDDNPPKALLDMAEEVICHDDPMHAILKVLKVQNGTLLLLWDNETPENSEKIAIMAADMGITMKDLSDGLTPIVVEEESSQKEIVVEPAPKEESAPNKNTEAVPFNREELLGMSIGSLRRQAKAMGIENIGQVNKETIVDMILDERTPEVASDIHFTTTVVQTNGTAMLVWYQDGELHNATVSLAEAMKLLS